MSQKITCPHCEQEFPMAEGLSSHLKVLEDTAREKIEKEQDQKLKENQKKLQLLENANKEKDAEIKSINEQKEDEIKKAVKDNIKIEGPFAADTIFIPEKWAKYNLIIAHYHDKSSKYQLSFHF